MYYMHANRIIAGRMTPVNDKHFYQVIKWDMQ